jgi:membrane protein
MAARRADWRAWLAGIALLGAYGVSTAAHGGGRRRVVLLRQEEQEKRIPERGWPFWQYVLGRTYAEYNKDRLLLLAAAAAFYGVLALVPAITAAVSLYTLIADPQTVQDQVNALQGIMPSGSFDMVKQQVGRIASGETNTGVWFAAGIVIALWSATSGMKGLMDSLNVIYDTPDRRSFLRYNAVALLMTLGAIIWIGVAMIGLVGVPLAAAYLPAASFGNTLADWVRWPMLLAVLMVGLAALYRFAPDRRQPRWEWVSPGNLLAAAGWLIGSALLSWYLGNFANYNATYGSLGAAVALMLWFWITAIIVLFGGELNSEYDKAKGEARHRRADAGPRRDAA